MKQNRMMLIAAVMGIFSTCALAQAAKTVSELYPNLASMALVNAVPTALPEGVLLQAGEIKITQADLDAEFDKAPADMREQLRKNALFILEQMTTSRLLVQEAKKAVLQAGKDPVAMEEKEMIQLYFEGLSSAVMVSDTEIQDFYDANKDAVGGRSLEEVKESIVNYLRQQKKQEIAVEHIQTFGKRIPMEISAEWLKKQAVLAMDNPVDKARASGKPSLIDFGSHGCRPCDMLTPILAKLETKYEGKANVLFVSVREEQFLASRYGIQSIPVQIFFDKDGKEFFRHAGFWPQEELEGKMAEMGVE